jgi:hypothetical protein
MQKYPTSFATWLSRLGEERLNANKEPSMQAKLWSTGRKIVMPITRVPLNYIAETMMHAFGGSVGTARLLYAMHKGLDKLHPEEADAIIRNFKQGMVGKGFMAIGFFCPDAFGGYYQQGEKRDEDLPHWGNIKAFGVEISHVFLHNPLLEMMQFGATLRHSIGEEYSQLPAGALAATMGIVKGAPIFSETIKLLESAKNAKTASDAAGKLTAGAMVPGVVQEVAGWTDDADKETEKRRPSGFAEQWEYTAPVTRNWILPKPLKRHK